MCCHRRDRAARPAMSAYRHCPRRAPTSPSRRSTAAACMIGPLPPSRRSPVRRRASARAHNCRTILHRPSRATPRLRAMQDCWRRDPGVEPERPHRRDEMSGIAGQNDTAVPPFSSDAVIDLEQVGSEDLDVRHVTDEVNGLLAQLVDRIFPLTFIHWVKKAPAVRLPDEDHPFLRVAEVG